jgi:3-phosphoglycerate kinase
MFTKKTVREIDLRGKRVLLRADYNVPLKDGRISDDYRIKQSLETVKYILDQEGSSLVIISHLGRPDGKPDPAMSLAPVAKRLRELMDREVGFAADCVGDEAKNAAAQLQPGGILVFENLRFHPEEEKNDAGFAQALVDASAAEIFVQDGFGVVHRAHASTEAITKLLPAVAGLLLEREVDIITKTMQDPARPLVAVVGGAKISDKIDVLKKFIDICDCVAVVGALANDFLIAQGHTVGKSLSEPESLEIAKQALEEAQTIEKQREFSFLVPVDAVVSTDISGKAATRIVDISSNTLADIQAYPKTPAPEASAVAADELILDIGPISAAYIAGAIKVCKTVVWAGPCGVTETKGLSGAQAPFAHGTKVVVEAMIGDSNHHTNKPFSLVGGGDTVAYVESEGLVEDFNHVSTGGSASLELMSGKALPGVEALLNKEG